MIKFVRLLLTESLECLFPIVKKEDCLGQKKEDELVTLIEGEGKRER